MKANKKITLLVTLILLSVVVVNAQEENTKTNLAEIEYKQIVIQENAKTQAYIKQELAKRDAEIEKKVYKYIDDNFAVLDKRIDEFIRKASFKLGMVFFSGLVLGGTILMLINKKIKRKMIGRKNLTPEQSKGETIITTIPDETIERMKKLREGEQPKKLMNEIEEIKQSYLDEINTEKAGVNDYLKLSGEQQ